MRAWFGTRGDRLWVWMLTPARLGQCGDSGRTMHRLASSGDCLGPLATISAKDMLAGSGVVDRVVMEESGMCGEQVDAE
jgi:hypothetical protein